MFDPTRYSEDWYIDMKGEYQKFFDYIIEMCDCAGVWKPNRFDFETKTGFKINLDSFLQKVNKDKERLIVLENGRWFIPGFVKFQSYNKSATFDLNPANRFHRGILNSLNANKIPYSLLKGLRTLVGSKMGAKDKDKDKDVFEVKEGGVGETIRNNVYPESVCYDVEKDLTANQIEFERICMATGKTAEEATLSLKKHHLWNESKSRYPLGKRAAFAGFEIWLMNEKSILNGKGTKGDQPKLGTSAKRNQALGNL